MDSDDDNPRPNKRQRVEEQPSSPIPPSSSLTPPPSSPIALTEDSSATDAALKCMPPAVLLVSLPSLLAQPPNHRFYVQSLYLSICALRKCLSLKELPPDIECRAWTSFAEVGIKVTLGGLTEDENLPWARTMEAEVEKALSRGSMLAQKHPSLRIYKLHLSLLQIQLSQWQQKNKFAKIQIRHLISSFQPTDPAHLVYSAQLAAITLFTSSQPVPNPLSSLPSPTPVSTATVPSPAYTHHTQDVHAALSFVSEIQDRARTHDHAQVVLLSHVLRLRILVAANMWSEVAAAVQLAESGLGLSYVPATTPKPRQPGKENVSIHVDSPDSTPQGKQKEDKLDAPDTQDEFIFFEDPFEAAMAVHTLIMSVIYYTYVGVASEAAPRLSHLHALLDSGALEKFSDGIVQATIRDGPPLSVQVTHPRVLFLLAFLVSSVAKRDAVGRRPKRKIFAVEGLKSWDRELCQEIALPLWSSLGDINEVEQRLARLKADLLCELIAVAIMRSEFDSAGQTLDELVAHTRSYSIFPLFAARITLHHAHLAHALNQPQRALECYQVAFRLADQGTFVALSAQAGEMILRIGLSETRADSDELPVGKKEALAVAKACRGMGGALEPVAHVLEALVSPEILKAKQHLKDALELASKAQDNYLRAVVLALIAAHYLHTASEHAFSMLQTCEQLAAGLGAPPAKGSSSEPTGHLRLGLWVGQKYLELYKRAGKDARAQKQLLVNQRMEEALNALRCRSVNVELEAQEASSR